MKVQKCIKESFSVIGKEGSTNDGNGFIQELWNDANSHFNEVAELAKKAENGKLIGIWGVMSDLSRSYMPWDDNFTKGYYLAGVEVSDDASAPQGWVKWTIPSYEYIYVKNDSPDTFENVIEYLNKNKIDLVGAVHDFNCPESKEAYMFFPVKKL
ncbi:MAG: AraC family transcriptional regulator [Firmicutes bacterium HGW-Firmicutes-3]|jgi:predicted transcriptional regulator YdeE|nr:MAG: AraC family transcriptional regulator [Firmicutes bacterium HGW-Firmicutes-3]